MSQEDDILLVSENKNEVGNFDSMRVFIPMVTHLLRVAQANMASPASQAIRYQVLLLIIIIIMNN